MRDLIRIVVVGLAAGALASCGVDPDASSVDSANRVTGGASVEYEWHAGDAFLEALDPAFAPAVARADNGDTIELRVNGTLGLKPKSVTGGGTFVHKDPDGNVIADGTVTAMQLLSFNSWGTSPALPATFESGLAHIAVELSPAGAPVVLGAVLRVNCVLPDSLPPAGTPGGAEGVRLALKDTDLNFNREVSGATLFIRLP